MGSGGVPSGGVTVVYSNKRTSLPLIGKPNSRIDLYVGDIKVLSRWYDWNGQAIKDRVVQRGLFLEFNTSKGYNREGRSQTYGERGIEVPERIKSYLEKLQKAGDFIEGTNGSFTMNDVQVMSKETGVEFAKVTVGGKEYLIRGSEKGTVIPVNIITEIINNSGTLDFHSHPYDGDLMPSSADRETIANLQDATGQEISTIITPDGYFAIFDKDGVVEVGMLGNDVGDDYYSFISELFGGEYNDQNG